MWKLIEARGAGSVLLLLCLAASATAELAGRVVYADNRPAEGAIVYALNAGKALQVQGNIPSLGERFPRAITDETGRFSLNLSGNGTVPLFAQDMEDQSGILLAASSGRSNTIIIKEAAGLAVRLPGDRNLTQGERILVRYIADTPMLDYRAKHTHRRKAPYRFSRLMPGRYQVLLSHDVPQVGCCFNSVITNRGEITLRAGTKSTISWEASNMPYVQGRIVSSTGEGLHGVWVRLIPNAALRTQGAGNTALERSWSAVTERDGRYEIYDVPPGAYTVRAFRRLAQNSASHTLEGVGEVRVPTEYAQTKTAVPFDMAIDLEAFAPLGIGQKAPDGTAQSLQGRAVRLTDFRGRYVVLHFYAGWCTACVNGLNIFNQLSTSFPDERLAVVGISLDESLETCRAFAQEKGINHTVLYEGSWSQNRLRKDYRVTGIPYTVVIDPAGTIIQTNVHGALLIEYITDQITP